MIFTRKRSRNESRSFAAARASTSAEEQKEIYRRKFYSKKLTIITFIFNFT